MNTTSAGARSSRSAAGAGAASNRRSSGTISNVPAKPAARTVSALRSSHSTAAGSAASIRARRSAARSCSVQGRATAPMRKHATSASTHSSRLPITVMTTSPGPTPRATSVPASRAAPSATAPKLCSVRRPSASIVTSAILAGSAASTTSRAKFTGGILPGPDRATRLTALMRIATKGGICGGGTEFRS